MNNNLYVKAHAFAIRIIKTYNFLTDNKREFIISKQLLKSGTSIGANIAEANGAFSKADFNYKLSISYKECLETKYWLTLLKDKEYLHIELFQSLYKDADELGKILYTILNKSQSRK